MSSRTILIGFSGVSLPLADMPFVRDGSASGLRAELTFPPAISSVGAWTSLITGRSPAQHGIFDFYRRQSARGQQLRVLASRDISGETIWSALDRQSLKATILNYPMTFPAPKIEGQVLPGSWVSPKRLALGCYPSDLCRQLSALEGVDVNDLTAEPLFRVLVHLMEKEPSDLSIVLVRDKGPLDFAAIDRHLERVVRAAGPDSTLLLISEPLADTKGFSANAWLAEHGYLAWTSSPNPGAVDGKVLETADLNRQAALIDWTKTRAWSPPSGGNGIFIVRQDAKSPAGVSDDEYEGFRNRLMQELSVSPAISRLWKQEDLYAGPFQELAPDLMIEWSGNARGIVLGRGPALKRGTVSGLTLSAITPLLLYTLGLQLPDDIEGSIPSEILDPVWMENHPVISGAASHDREPDKPLIDPKDEEEILRRLRGLGYLE
jgi:predicted AlkP superfamily phosphohydrolase/phosphomutase